MHKVKRSTDLMHYEPRDCITKCRPPVIGAVNINRRNGISRQWRSPKRAQDVLQRIGPRRANSEVLWAKQKDGVRVTPAASRWESILWWREKSINEIDGRSKLPTDAAILNGQTFTELRPSIGLDIKILVLPRQLSRVWCVKGAECSFGLTLRHIRGIHGREYFVFVKKYIQVMGPIFPQMKIFHKRDLILFVE
ncbi:hypothetical protein K438DRAFT_1764713 [Mycena galopus ATCC 62051]|nr:hypothetical protein K438DRAFT_1764713 [Mycena galopus ATCC 62051]